MASGPLNCLPWSVTFLTVYAQLHETLNLYVSPTAYVFEPTSSSYQGNLSNGPTLINEKDARESLHVDRRTGKIELNVGMDVPFAREKVITCYGIIGILSLATTDFLLIITSRSQSCRLLSHSIYQATDYRLLPLSPLSTSSAILDHPVEKELISLVEQGLRSAALWFSYGWDLTNTLQRQKEAEEKGEGAGQLPMWKRANDGFFWNKFLMERLIHQTEIGQGDLSRFILPIVYGSVELRGATINNRDILFLLMSRRSRYRAGTRYFSRGINHQGEVSNFNETEQIVLLDPLPTNGEPVRRGRVDGRERLSFVQLRGSVPIFWAEVNNLRYKPDLQIMDVADTTSAMKTHLYSVCQTHQRVSLVNMVNHKGHELPVKEAFERAYTACANSDPVIAANVQYNYFDFHTQCKNMRFDRVSLLIDQISSFLDESAWYRSITPPNTNLGTSGGEATVLSKQSGVVRSNCMDCLDRTNVAQSALGKWALNKQLREAGVLSIKESVDDHEDFMSIFRNVWADHGDTLSRAYAGTGALKSDFVRTGKRSTEGTLQDGYNSVTRYVKNNFFDGDRQDAFDILTGAWVAQKGGIPPLTDTRPLLMRSMPYVLAFAMTMIFAAMTLPRSSDLSISSFLFIWLALATFSISFIWGNGISYVSWPRLNPPLEVLSYSGPGMREPPRGRGMAVSSMLPLLQRKVLRKIGMVKRGHAQGSYAMQAGYGPLSGSGEKSRKVEEVELGRFGNKKGALND